MCRSLTGAWIESLGVGVCTVTGYRFQGFVKRHFFCTTHLPDIREVFPVPGRWYFMVLQNVLVDELAAFGL